MQPVRDEERHHDDVRARREPVPFCDERRFLHVGIQHLAVAPERGDAVHLAFRGAGGIFVQVRPVAHDEKARLPRRHARRNFGGPLQQQLRHARMISDRLAIFHRVTSDPRDRIAETEFARDDRLREVALADEIRHDIHVLAIHAVQHLPQARLLFPKRAMHLAENSAPADFLSEVPSRRARVGIQRRAVSGDDQRAVGFLEHWIFCVSAALREVQWFPSGSDGFSKLERSNRVRTVAVCPSCNRSANTGVSVTAPCGARASARGSHRRARRGLRLRRMRVRQSSCHRSVPRSARGAATPRRGTGAP